MMKLDGTPISILENDITWADDIGKKFKKTSDSEKTQWVNPENGCSNNKLNNNLLRTFHCLDETGRPSEFPQTLGKNRAGPQCRKIHYYDTES